MSNNKCIDIGFGKHNNQRYGIVGSKDRDNPKISYFQIYEYEFDKKGNLISKKLIVNSAIDYVDIR
tara:strand:- start:13 stop:210 length:198 start_codon:yes stop_codon:yes gene_type:complete